jgi:sigma-B regulation protein RsbU (phosphoserine phosphatase)
VLFSDGLSEAFDEKDAAFGDTELSALAGEMATQSADAMTEGLLAGALRFAGNAPQADDMTVLVLKREKGPARHWAGPFTC